MSGPSNSDPDRSRGTTMNCIWSTEVDSILATGRPLSDLCAQLGTRSRQRASGTGSTGQSWHRRARWRHLRARRLQLQTEPRQLALQPHDRGIRQRIPGAKHFRGSRLHIEVRTFGCASALCDSSRHKAVTADAPELRSKYKTRSCVWLELTDARDIELLELHHEPGCRTCERYRS